MRCFCSIISSRTCRRRMGFDFYNVIFLFCLISGIDCHVIGGRGGGSGSSSGIIAGGFVCLNMFDDIDGFVEWNVKSGIG